MRFSLAFLIALFETAWIPNEVYGKPSSSSGGGAPQTPNKVPNGLKPLPDISNAPDLCQSPEIDAVTKTQDGKTYVFKGEFYWRIMTDGIADGYPRVIKSDWDGLPGSLDAALTWSDGKTFFFKGSQYWKFYNQKMEAGYPKEISVGFKGIPNNLDAALLWSGNGKTYFFKGDKYWRFDSRQDPPVSDRYPKAVSSWEGVPDNVDAAFQWENGKTYFFKGRNYYKFNDNDFKVETANPSYPRTTAVWWFDCKAMSGKDMVHRSGVMKSDVTINIPWIEDSTSPGIESDTSPGLEDKTSGVIQINASPTTDQGTSEDSGSWDSESWEDFTPDLNKHRVSHKTTVHSGVRHFDVGIWEENTTTENYTEITSERPSSTSFTLTNKEPIVTPHKLLLLSILSVIYFQN